ncbi:UDP-glucose dehydrogenase family protein [Aquirufa antheringensis]|jgi:UDPglucose 6-dehydrogenase|uniref:UDP-glucose 6-dehydrogenase n=1 Tax=Aquirufa antheringensis TaxID=2516559 RepID=A0A4Q9B926_9BACT|nr:UDP-glucose/GDP-mannose dehydrogenase family protein [Aquirufa antheringensis]MCZ2486555.1 UDP-glucose/GDP-mannose dehydrogenase family protein [Aquirufa antheringensis]MCZ2488664.1 UDP-glucose/GDP-mannose dehydrogenase family protein [Aquirufa antheringensis]TBH71113.1 UDP-glucose/GDP-mannose dehydrogenase family protein [Aquirufa antheringensis]
MKIAVVGTGYVGLVTGTCFAETGNQVTCVDINAEKVQQMQAGKIPIYEPGLDDLFQRNTQEGRLHFTTSLKEGIEGAKVIFLALPTPPGADGSADLKYILQVANDLGPILSDYTVIIDKSTVPVGTSDKVRAAIAKNATVDFDVVSNPEFLREGVAVEDFMKPDRVVIGTQSDRAKDLMSRLYAPLVRQGNPIIFMDERSAELTKYAANAFLATKITFMNEIANLCELVGANVDEVRKGIGTDSRIGKRFLFAGIGYGGSCFPKDVQALAKTSAENDYEFKILDSVMQVNESQKTKLIPHLAKHFKGDLAGKKIAMWGLAFKPYTDDIREAPALYNIDALLELGATVSAYDPEAMGHVKQLMGDKITFTKNPYEALENADALLIVTEWPQFRTPDFERMDSLLKNKVIFDGRNLYELNQMQELGYTYYSIGRQTIH